jgi:hypothetical protein
VLFPLRAALVVVALTPALFVAACSADSTDPNATKPAAAPGPGDAGATDAASDAGTSSRTYAPLPPVCTSFVYSDWSVCHFDGTQTRRATQANPPGCYNGGPVLRQSCTFTPPTDGPGLYEAYCSGCHGDAKKGVTASDIEGAIQANRGGMSELAPLLTTGQIALIGSAF